MFKDDKSYPYLAVSMETPALGHANVSAPGRVFGPYTRVGIRETIDQLLRVFPMRSCSAGVFSACEGAGASVRGYIDKCAAPCVGRISWRSIARLAEGLCQFMEGARGGEAAHEKRTKTRCA